MKVEKLDTGTPIRLTDYTEFQQLLQIRIINNYQDFIQVLLQYMTHKQM
jgi:hypothetical protein